MRLFSGRLSGFVSLGIAAALVVAGVAPASAAESAMLTSETGASSPTVASTVLTANLADFRPGEIISDSVFFNSSTMNEQQIQSFLESKVPSCQSGYTCLKDWYDTTRATQADAMCGAYAGGGRERASTIIYKVAQACGINPQVLIVTLQKEQALVTHTWPSTWRYTSAMGQGCPDTAACDTRYYGFFNQVYGAAWQLKRYANPPGTSQYFTWYAPGKTWNVLYNPNRDCGSGAVYIQNQATADLYYYTPYQPNRAALNAGYGEGDGCSSYGNRNFYNYFTDWFGSTIAFATSGAIATAWNAQGGANGWLGQPSAQMVYSGASGGGWYQYFQNGIIFVVQGGPTTILRTGSALAQLFMSTGGPAGWLGWPTAGESCGTYGCAVSFQNGTSAWSNKTGAIQQLNGGLNSAWLDGGGVNNRVGVPAASMVSVGGVASGWYQAFDYGYVFLRAGKPAQSLMSASGITQRYLGAGGPTSSLGWPVSAESCQGSSCAASFDGGVSVWTDRVGIVDVTGAVAAAWTSKYGLGSWLGGPTATPRTHTAGGGGVSQLFQAGYLYVQGTRAGVALRTNSGITQRYEAAGGPGSAYGWPTGEEQCFSTVCSTDFESATIAWDLAYGLHDVSGAMREEFRTRGGLAGTLGAPATDTLAVSGTAGVRQDFRGGWVYLKSGGSAVVLRPDSGLAAQYRTVYQGPEGSLGWPTAPEVCDDVECRISFETGTLAWNRTTGAITRR